MNKSIFSLRKLTFFDDLNSPMYIILGLSCPLSGHVTIIQCAKQSSSVISFLTFRSYYLIQ